MEELPLVARCEVNECFYNRDRMCHAPAISVGGNHPNCDAFIPTGQHSNRQGTGQVGACHISQCRFNADLTCNADGIVVAHHSDHADCDTFEPTK